MLSYIAILYYIMFVLPLRIIAYNDVMHYYMQISPSGCRK